MEKEILTLNCDCKTPEHIISFWADVEEKEISVSVQLFQHRGFFHRLYYAFKYIFNIGKDSHWDSAMLSGDNAIELYSFLNNFNKDVKNDKSKAITST